MEERIEALERKLTALTKADEKEDIETNNKFVNIERKFVELSNADEKKHIENHKQFTFGVDLTFTRQGRGE